MQTFYSTDPGKVRENNEDSVIILNNDNNEYVLAVADGMGGHNDGEVASMIAINHLTEEFYRLDSLGTKENAIEWLREIVVEINDKIFDYTKENPSSQGMGTTFVIAIKTDDYILFGNIGDSSGFVIRKDGKLQKATKDHSLVNDMVSIGKITEAEAKHNPFRNVLTRALGANNPIEIDIFDVDMSVVGLLLCSDGLTTMLTEDQIERVINSDLEVSEVVDRLIKKCNSRGGNDNISIAYLKKESGDL